MPMKKAPSLPLLSSQPILSPRSLFILGFKLIIALSILLCFFAFWKLQSDEFPNDTVSTSRLARRPRSLTSNSSFEGVPKIAFLFLVRRDLPLDFLWSSFFEDADAGKYSIYIHSQPGFVFDDTKTRSPLFYGRQLNNSIQVEWGKSTMIEAEKLLLDAALEDPANQRFILLSDSCVPLYNFSYIYSYVMMSPNSFVDSFLDKRDERYNPKMKPYIPKNKWRKGSQWVTLIRNHAEVVADDHVVFPVFVKFCKRRPPVDEGKQNLKLQKQHNCIPDEHYVQTLLAMSGHEKDIERRTLTYSLWNQVPSKMEKKSWHPVTFSYTAASPKRIGEIKGISHVYYETEYRTEWCRSNSTSVPCFLFARKFSQGAAMRLLSDGIVGRYDPASLLEKQP